MARTETEETIATTETEETMARTETEETMARTETEETMARTETEETIARTETEETIARTETEETMAKTLNFVSNSQFREKKFSLPNLQKIVCLVYLQKQFSSDSYIQKMNELTLSCS
jgi:hypothetical protein